LCDTPATIQYGIHRCKSAAYPLFPTSAQNLSRSSGMVAVLAAQCASFPAFSSHGMPDRMLCCKISYFGHAARFAPAMRRIPGKHYLAVHIAWHCCS
ncbi:MAG: hypothetical protein RRZ71_08070, partial [Clostridia bacterium]